MPEDPERSKVLDKLRKLCLHEKSAKDLGSEAEALAFAAKIQDLLSVHRIELSEVEFEKLDETDPVSQKLVDFASANIDIKRCRIAWHEDLADMVCRAYFCNFIACTGSSHLWFVGRHTDLEASEQVFLYLVRVATNLADAAYVKYFYECKRLGEVERARGFRPAYLTGFCRRLSERYDEERENIKKQWASSQVALVRLTDALVPVQNYLDKMSESGQTRMAPGVRGRRSDNEEGTARGRSDAEKVPIGQNQRQVS